LLVQGGGLLDAGLSEQAVSDERKRVRILPQSGVFNAVGIYFHLA